MSALMQVFVRVHARYDQDRYADDLEQFAAWLLNAGYPNKSCRRHLYWAQQALHAIDAMPGAVVDLGVLECAFRRLTLRCRGCVHTCSAYAHYLRATGRLVEKPAPADALDAVIRGFCERLTRRRGLAVSTVAGYHHWISDFLRRTLPRDRLLSDRKRLPTTV